MSGFTSAVEEFLEPKAGDEAKDSSQESIQTQDQSQEDRTPQQESSESSGKSVQEIKDDLVELERIEKFKFQNKEYSAKELATLIKRGEDTKKEYTRLTQQIAERERSEKEEEKFRLNYKQDVKSVRENPALALEFFKVYPEKYHKLLEEDLKSSSPVPEQEQRQQSSAPQIPFEILNDLHFLKSKFQKQEEERASLQIDRDLNNAVKEYDFADREQVMNRVSIWHKEQMDKDPSNGFIPVPEKVWKEFAEMSHNHEKAKYEARYNQQVTQQKEANKKAQDVGPGGATPANAPRRFDPKQGFKGLRKQYMEHLGLEE